MLQTHLKVTDLFVSQTPMTFFYSEFALKFHVICDLIKTVESYGN